MDSSILPGFCSKCFSNQGIRACSCGIEGYCSDSCKAEHWTVHSKLCAKKMRSISSQMQIYQLATRNHMTVADSLHHSTQGLGALRIAAPPAWFSNENLESLFAEMKSQLKQTVKGAIRLLSWESFIEKNIALGALNGLLDLTGMLEKLQQPINTTVATNINTPMMLIGVKDVPGNVTWSEVYASWSNKLIELLGSLMPVFPEAILKRFATLGDVMAMIVREFQRFSAIILSLVNNLSATLLGWVTRLGELVSQYVLKPLMKIYQKVLDFAGMSVSSLVEIALRPNFQDFDIARFAAETVFQTFLLVRSFKDATLPSTATIDKIVTRWRSFCTMFKDQILPIFGVKVGFNLQTFPLISDLLSRVGKDVIEAGAWLVTFIGDYLIKLAGNFSVFCTFLFAAFLTGPAQMLLQQLNVKAKNIHDKMLQGYQTPAQMLASMDEWSERELRFKNVELATSIKRLILQYNQLQKDLKAAESDNSSTNPDSVLKNSGPLASLSLLLVSDRVFDENARVVKLGITPFDANRQEMRAIIQNDNLKMDSLGLSKAQNEALDKFSSQMEKVRTEALFYYLGLCLRYIVSKAYLRNQMRQLGGVSVKDKHDFYCAQLIKLSWGKVPVPVFLEGETLRLMERGAYLMTQVYCAAAIEYVSPEKEEETTDSIFIRGNMSVGAGSESRDVSPKRKPSPPRPFLITPSFVEETETEEEKLARKKEREASPKRKSKKDAEPESTQIPSENDFGAEPDAATPEGEETAEGSKTGRGRTKRSETRREVLDRVRKAETQEAETKPQDSGDSEAMAEKMRENALRALLLARASKKEPPKPETMTAPNFEVEPESVVVPPPAPEVPSEPVVVLPEPKTTKETAKEILARKERELMEKLKARKQAPKAGFEPKSPSVVPSVPLETQTKKSVPPSRDTSLAGYKSKRFAPRKAPGQLRYLDNIRFEKSETMKRLSELELQAKRKATESGSKRRAAPSGGQEEEPKEKEAESGTSPVPILPEIPSANEPESTKIPEVTPRPSSTAPPFSRPSAFRPVSPSSTPAIRPSPQYSEPSEPRPSSTRPMIPGGAQEAEPKAMNYVLDMETEPDRGSATTPRAQTPRPNAIPEPSVPKATVKRTKPFNPAATLARAKASVRNAALKEWEEERQSLESFIVANGGSAEELQMWKARFDDKSSFLRKGMKYNGPEFDKFVFLLEKQANKKQERASKKERERRQEEEKQKEQQRKEEEATQLARQEKEEAMRLARQEKEELARLARQEKEKESLESQQRKAEKREAAALSQLSEEERKLREEHQRTIREIERKQELLEQEARAEKRQVYESENARLIAQFKEEQEKERKRLKKKVKKAKKETERLRSTPQPTMTFIQPTPSPSLYEAQGYRSGFGLGTLIGVFIFAILATIGTSYGWAEIQQTYNYVHQIQSLSNLLDTSNANAQRVTNFYNVGQKNDALTLDQENIVVPSPYLKACLLEGEELDQGIKRTADAWNDDKHRVSKENPSLTVDQVVEVTADWWMELLASDRKAKICLPAIIGWYGNKHYITDDTATILNSMNEALKDNPRMREHPAFRAVRHNFETYSNAIIQHDRPLLIPFEVKQFMSNTEPLNSLGAQIYYQLEPGSAFVPRSTIQELGLEDLFQDQGQGTAVQITTTGPSSSTPNEPVVIPTETTTTPVGPTENRSVTPNASSTPLANTTQSANASPNVTVQAGLNWSLSSDRSILSVNVKSRPGSKLVPSRGSAIQSGHASQKPGAIASVKVVEAGTDEYFLSLYDLTGDPELMQRLQKENPDIDFRKVANQLRSTGTIPDSPIVTESNQIINQTKTKADAIVTESKTMNEGGKTVVDNFNGLLGQLTNSTSQFVDNLKNKGFTAAAPYLNETLGLVVAGVFAIAFCSQILFACRFFFNRKLSVLMSYVALFLVAMILLLSFNVIFSIFVFLNPWEFLLFVYTQNMDYAFSVIKTAVSGIVALAINQFYRFIKQKSQDSEIEFKQHLKQSEEIFSYLKSNNGLSDIQLEKFRASLLNPEKFSDEIRNELIELNQTVGETIRKRLDAEAAQKAKDEVKRQEQILKKKAESKRRKEAEAAMQKAREQQIIDRQTRESERIEEERQERMALAKRQAEANLREIEQKQKEKELEIEARKEEIRRKQEERERIETERQRALKLEEERRQQNDLQAQLSAVVSPESTPMMTPQMMEQELQRRVQEALQEERKKQAVLEEEAALKAAEEKQRQETLRQQEQLLALQQQMEQMKQDALLREEQIKKDAEKAVRKAEARAAREKEKLLKASQASRSKTSSSRTDVSSDTEEETETEQEKSKTQEQTDTKASKIPPSMSRTNSPSPSASSTQSASSTETSAAAREKRLSEITTMLGRALDRYLAGLVEKEAYLELAEKLKAEQQALEAQA